MDNFSDHYLKSTLNQLNNLKKEIEYIEYLYNKFKAKLLNIQSLSDSSGKIKNLIEKFIYWINNFNKNEDNIKKKNEFNNNLKSIFENYISIYGKENIDEINKAFENMKMIYEDIIDGFDPSNNGLNEIINIQINNSSDKSTNEMEEEFDQLFHQNNDEDYSKFYGESEKKSEKKCDKYLMCNKCCNQEAKYFCENHCNMYFCENCHHDIINYENFLHHTLKRIDEAKVEIEEEKKKFIQSFVRIFKYYLMKCNYILKNKNYNFVDPKTFKKFKYPSLQSSNFMDLEIQKKFLEEINGVENIIREKIDINKSINEEDINYIIINELENMFRNKKVHIGNDLNNLEDDFFEEKFVIGEDDKSNSNSNNSYNNNNNNSESDDDIPLNEFESIKKKFLYIINVIKTQNYDFDNEQFSQKIIKQISENLSLNKEKILIKYNNNVIFVNDFIKTKLFSSLKFKDLRTNYPNIPKLYEFKLLIEGLILYECRIPKEKLDFKYNFISPNINLNNRRGKEIYQPPYGWYGIGLNVTNKYENNDWINKIDSSSKWAVAYYGFPKYLQEKDVKNKLKDIVENNKFEIEENLQINFCHSWDKRHEGKKVGNGFYLSPNINLVEGYSKAILFNKKKYKIIIMAKVLIKNIKEPKYFNYWIINKKEDIRFYRILIKEVI